MTPRIRPFAGVLVLLVAGAVVRAEPPAAGQDQHQHQPPGDPAGPDEPRTPIPPVTEDDVEAAFPDVSAHAMRDAEINYLVLLDRFEGVDAPGGPGLRWESTTWVGGDVNRLWTRTEGDLEGGRLGAADAHLLYGRAVARWWDLVVGVRQELRPAPARTWLAVGLQGLAPYWFDVEATAYVGPGGRTAARLEAEYELLVTNRLVLQQRIEVDLLGRDDPGRGLGAGVSTVETGVRLRYEIRRELAPYVGVAWEDAFGETARLHRAGGDTLGGARLVGGMRLWF